MRRPLTRAQRARVYLKEQASCAVCLYNCEPVARHLIDPQRAVTSTRSNGSGNGAAPRHDRYKWIALSNVTLGVLLATLDASITLIAMPDIFRGINLDPLVPANSFYLLWMILGFLVVTSVLIVSLGRLGDMFGRVRMYNLGFVIYTLASLALTIDWLTGPSGALYLIVFAGRAGCRRRVPAGQRGRDHHRRVPRQPARHGARASTTSSASAGCSSGWCSAACSLRSTGGSCSSSRCRSACSAPCGPT